MLPKGWMPLKEITEVMKKNHGKTVTKAEVDRMVLLGVVKTMKIKGITYYKAEG